jgi:KipI family sensor histidine kinase inhibitor
MRVDRLSEVRFRICGDRAISVELGDSIDPVVNSKVQVLFQTIRAHRQPGIVAVVPTYRSLLIHYDPWECSCEQLLLVIEECLAEPLEGATQAARRIEIPVCYGGEFGPDLENVAAHHGCSPEKVVEIHLAGAYRVYMIGFTPGFCYLGGLDRRLFMPRREEPRSRVPAGSVGIADRQTGIYSMASPGGWQLIGRTPLRLFDLEREEPFLLGPGDWIRLKAISRDEFRDHQDH